MVLLQRNLIVPSFYHGRLSLRLTYRWLFASKNNQITTSEPQANVASTSLDLDVPLTRDGKPSIICQICEKPYHDARDCRKRSDTITYPPRDERKRAKAMFKKVHCPIISLDCDLKKVNFAGSCNGLLFLYREETLNFEKTDEFWLWNPCLWNPSTQEFKYLQRPGFPVSETACVLHRGHGFGYDAETDDYKCIRIFNYSGDRHSQVHIYSLRSNTWKLTHLPYLLSADDRYFRAPNGVFCNGTLHWFVIKEYLSPQVLMAFNMTDEGIREIPQPESVEELGYVKNVDVLDGYLCILCRNSAAYEVWLMKDYGMRESWTKAYNIPRPTLELGAQKFVDLKKIECLKTGEILLEVQYNNFQTAALVFYDPKNETATYLKLYENFGDYPILRSASYRYVKSLVKLKSDYYVEDNERKDGQQSIIHIYKGLMH
ncbi:F-box protein CPR1-like [Papaver somniferum]|uniref:F-box protein CPR1-like n=1 Tax=Papaver somniferum TaxID=3469 RepID=UPI000E6F4C41|nr:F-box protein CPR1-like [Papaver somniferum]